MYNDVFSAFVLNRNSKASENILLKINSLAFFCRVYAHRRKYYNTINNYVPHMVVYNCVNPPKLAVDQQG